MKYWQKKMKCCIAILASLFMIEQGIDGNEENHLVFGYQAEENKGISYEKETEKIQMKQEYIEVEWGKVYQLEENGTEILFEEQAGNIVIYGIFGETDSEGYTVVGAWGDAQTGTSTTVYKPADFDESNPVYRVKIWDSYGNVTERDVNLNEINVSNCDTFDFYAYSCYLSNSGKYPFAMQDFMMTHAHYKGEEGFGKSSYSDMLVKFDWTSVIKSLMSMQYRCGNIKGYWDYRNFYDFLEG